MFMLTQGSEADQTEKAVHESEAWAQQQSRFEIAKQGGYAFRNNVGATPTKCKACGAAQRPVRYGLANDSTQMNKRIKSSDLILAIPRRITPDMIGSTIAQFGAVECKKPGWAYSGKSGEPQQAAWLTFIESLGGFARFSTGGVDLSTQEE
jgi:hypothetical protein